MGGSSCTCNCARTTPEPSPEEDATPTGNPPKGLSGGALDEVTIPLGPSGTIPVVAKLRVLQQGWRDSGSRGGETPRSDEARQSRPRSGRSDPLATAGRSAGGDARSALGWTPRDSPQPSARGAVCENACEVSYQGTYLGAKKHGVGTLRMGSCKYVGDFWHDVQHGKATLTWDDGREYCGQFKDGKFHGMAVMTWPDGRKFTGQYANNQKHGAGTFTWQDGRCYDGQWVAGKRHGIGVYTNAKGLSCRGTWHLDRPLCWESDQAEEGREEEEEQAAASATVDAGATAALLQVPGKDSGSHVSLL